ncbi:MAG: hypothetical protein GSR80_000993 [Desulfurococcales archaeon]|nr:hypothetical protein [Desulfurococcales archaeon]
MGDRAGRGGGLASRLAGRVTVAMAVAFMVMLVGAAVALALSREDLANSMAEVAYYFLVIAVVAALIDVALEGPGEDSGEA